MLTVIGLVVALQNSSLVPGLRTRTPVLVYHDIIAHRDKSSLWFDCTTDEFKRQLDWMSKRGAHFISVDQLYYHLTTKAPIPSKAVCLTFADGYLGFYKNGVPVLRARHIPATMFVHTAFVGSPVGRPKMTWPQLLQLDREGLVKIGSQTLSHPPDLRTLPQARLDKEMSMSKASLQKHLGHAVTTLAYPNGKFDARVEAAAKRAGYAIAFTEDQKPAESAPNRFSVPRYVHTKYQQAWKDAGY